MSKYGITNFFMYLLTPVIVRLSNENCNYVDLQALEIKIVLLLGL